MDNSPREIPGYYWDSQQKRYFLITASHPAPPRPTSLAISTNTTALRDLPPSKRRRLVDSGLPSLAISTPRLITYVRSKGICKDTKALRLLRENGAAHRAEVSIQEVPTVRSSSSVEKFCVTTSNTSRRFIGDSHGWIYRSIPDPREGSRQLQVVTETALGSHVSTMVIQNDSLLASSFGPDPKMYYVKDDSSAPLILQPRRSIRDVRAVIFHGAGFILGAQKMAMIYPSFEHVDKTTAIPHPSDVFSLKLEGECRLFTGARNGGIKLFDLRVDVKHQQTRDLLNNRHRKRQSIISSLDVINEWQLLVGGTNHQLDLFDLRYLGNEPQPSVSFGGYFNDHQTNLPLLYDSHMNTVIAATADCKVKAWSAVDGRPLEPAARALTRRPWTFARCFDRPVSAMQIVNDRDMLYLAVGKTIQEHSLF